MKDKTHSYVRKLVVYTTLFASISTYADTFNQSTIGYSIWVPKNSVGFTTNPMVPVTVTNTTGGDVIATATVIHSYTSGTSCTNHISGSPTFNNGTFHFATGTHTYYLATLHSISAAACGSYPTNKDFSFFAITNSSGATCTPGGCANVTCSNTNEIASVISSLTITCS